jgi:DNA-binding LacI/PurR family transcriptional regulator
MGVLHLAGRRVPDDVALVGFDDIPLAQEMVPPLTTMRIPLDEIGRRAARRLRHLTTTPRHGLATAESEVIVPELIRRGTA